LSFGNVEVPKNRIEQFKNEIARVYSDRQTAISRSESQTKAAECSNAEKRRVCEMEWQKKLRKYQRLKSKIREREQVLFEVGELESEIALEQDSFESLEKQKKQANVGQKENELLANWKREIKMNEERLQIRRLEVEKKERHIENRKAECKFMKEQIITMKEEYRKLVLQVNQVESNLNDVGQKHDDVFRECQIMEAEFEADGIEELSRESVNDWDCSFS
jgi:chromosome segregation ATPase